VCKGRGKIHECSLKAQCTRVEVRRSAGEREKVCSTRLCEEKLQKLGRAREAHNLTVDCETQDRVIICSLYAIRITYTCELNW
jgi:hypothetical protein